VDVRRRELRLGIRQGLPWLVLFSALVLATIPTWRPLMFRVSPTLDDLLDIRCRQW